MDQKHANARLLLIEAGERRRQYANHPYPGKYWKDVIWHKLFAAQQVNRGELVSASCPFRDRG